VIKNVIFDLGKVLLDYDFDLVYDKLNRKAASADLQDSTQLIFSFEAGKISKLEFFNIIKAKYDLSVTLEQFAEIWCNIFSPFPDMIETASRISSRYSIYIFSNTDPFHFPYIWRKYPELHIFGDYLMLSYELGAVKPTPESYQKALKKFDLTPADCLFLDDKLENIKAADDLGIRSIHHKDQAETKGLLGKILQMEL